MITLSYVKGIREEIRIGEEYFFGQIWDGESGNGEELLESGTVSLNDGDVIAFEVVKLAEDNLDTVVRVMDIY